MVSAITSYRAITQARARLAASKCFEICSRYIVEDKTSLCQIVRDEKCYHVLLTDQSLYSII